MLDGPLGAHVDHGGGLVGRRASKELYEPGPIPVAVRPVGPANEAPQIAVRSTLLMTAIHDSASRDQPAQRAHREGTSAKAEQEDPVARLVDPGEIGIELAYVATEPEAKGATQRRQHFEAAGAHAIVVEPDLADLVGIRPVALEINGLVELEDIGASTFDRDVSRTIRANHDIFHRRLLRNILVGCLWRYLLLIDNERGLLLGFGVVELMMLYTPILVIIFSSKPLFFQGP